MSTEIQPVPDVILASEFPSLADRPAGTFNAKAKAWADSENAMATRTREIALTAHNNAIAAREAATEAVDVAVPAANIAVSARDEALEYRDSAAAIAGAIGDDAGLPSLVGNAGKALLVNQSELGVGWYDILPAIGYRHVTEADTVASGDRSTMVDCSGTFTLSFDACATLGNGWFTYIKNSGTGDITLDPAGSETIDGLTSYIMHPDEVRLIQCDGSALRSVLIGSKVYQSPDQTLVSGGLITLAHGLGVIPKSVELYLRCKAAQHGFSVGDVISVAGTTSATSTPASPWVIKVDDTEIAIRLNDETTYFARTMNWGTGANVLLSFTNWDIFVRASA